MINKDGFDEVVQFIERYRHIGLLSTSADVVDFEGDLYNVTESTDDPKQIPGAKGYGWKRLLIDRAGLAESECYVTDPLPDGESSHPDFQVGGHMTTNPSGRVKTGAISYLMPLCKWHNSTSRNEVPFQHKETRMLELGGFMEGDTPLTFAMRLGEDGLPRLLHFDALAGEWEYRSVEAEAGSIALHISKLRSLEGDAFRFAIFEKREGRYFMTASNLAEPAP